MKVVFPRKKFSSAWSEIEGVICELLPSCIKTILSESGYDSLLSINTINETALFEVEHFVNDNRNITTKLECCFADTYKNLEKFRFLPAHRLLVLRLPYYVYSIFGLNRLSQPERSIQQREIIGIARGKDASEYSFLMNKLIESAEENAGVSKNRYRYDEILHLFSMYIFLCSGRSCYEILSSNLPIPSKYSVCKCHAVFLYFVYILVYMCLLF